MQADPEYLRNHYASLSDEALLTLKRSDLVEVAQGYYDAEMQGRRLKPARSSVLKSPEQSDDGSADEVEQSAAEEVPAWLDEAAEVYSAVDRAGSVPAPDAANARDVLEAAGIPCYLELSEIPEDNISSPQPTHEWRLLVPGNLNLRAASILDRDIFNREFEAEWKAHLETLSDEELVAMSPQNVFCGLFDRVERVSRTYQVEIDRRRAQAE